MFGALSPTAVGDTSLAFVSAAAHGRGVREAYGLNKQTAPVRGCVEINHWFASGGVPTKLQNSISRSNRSRFG